MKAPLKSTGFSSDIAFGALRIDFCWVLCTKAQCCDPMRIGTDAGDGRGDSFAWYFRSLGLKHALYLDGFVSRTYLAAKGGAEWAVDLG